MTFYRVLIKASCVLTSVSIDRIVNKVARNLIIVNFLPMLWDTSLMSLSEASLRDLTTTVLCRNSLDVAEELLVDKEVSLMA